MDSYLPSVIRYVHKNPLAAGISKGLSYPWRNSDLYLSSNFST